MHRHSKSPTCLLMLRSLQQKQVAWSQGVCMHALAGLVAGLGGCLLTFQAQTSPVPLPACSLKMRSAHLLCRDGVPAATPDQTTAKLLPADSTCISLQSSLRAAACRVSAHL